MITITRVREYSRALKSINKKYITLEMLMKKTGRVGEVINDDLVYFDPLIKFDVAYNYATLLPKLEEYIANYEQTLQKPREIVPVKAKELDKYDSISDFIYQKMTIGKSGIIDKNRVLTDRELRALKRLINDEQARRKAEKKK
jgi:hypothetical protein